MSGGYRKKGQGGGREYHQAYNNGWPSSTQLTHHKKYVTSFSVQEVQKFLQQGCDKLIREKKDVNPEQLVIDCCKYWRVDDFSEFGFGPAEKFWPVSGYFKRRNAVQEVQQVAEMIIQSKKDAGSVITFSSVLGEVLHLMDVTDFAELKIGKPFAIPALRSLANRESAFLTVLMCYISTRTFGSLYDFEQFVLQHDFRDVDTMTCFEDLGLGPLLSIPEVRKSFAIPDGTTVAPTISVQSMITVFVDLFCGYSPNAKKKFKDGNRGRDRVTIGSIIQALEDHFQMPKEELCVSLSDRNFGQYVITVVEILKMQNAEIKQMRTDFVTKALDENQSTMKAWEKNMARVVRKSQHVQLLNQLESRFAKSVQAAPGALAHHVMAVRMTLQQAIGQDDPMMNIVVFTALIHSFCLRLVEQGVAKQQGQSAIDAHIARMHGGPAPPPGVAPAGVLPPGVLPPGVAPPSGYGGGYGQQQQPNMQVSAYDLIHLLLQSEKNCFGEWQETNYEWAGEVRSALEAAQLVENDICNQLSAMTFSALGHGSFLEFLQQSEETMAVKEHLESFSSPSASGSKGTGKASETAVVMDVAMKYLRAHPGIPSWKMLQKIETAILKHYNSISWQDIIPNSTYTSFVAANLGVFNDIGYAFFLGGKKEASGENDDDSASDKIPLQVVLSYLRQIENAGCSKKAQAALCAEFRVSTVQQLGFGPLDVLERLTSENQDYNSNNDVLVFASMVSYLDRKQQETFQFDLGGEKSFSQLSIKEDGGDSKEDEEQDDEIEEIDQDDLMVGFGQAEIDTSSIRDAMAADESALVDLIADLDAASQVDDLATALQWSEIFESKYGNLASFLTAHTEELSARGVKLLTCKVPEGGLKFYLASGGASDVSAGQVGLALASDDYRRAGTLLGLLVVQTGVSRLPQELLKSSMVECLCRLQQSVGPAGFATAVFELLLGVPLDVLCRAQLVQNLLGPALTVVVPSWETVIASFLKQHPQHSDLFKIGLRIGIKPWTDYFVSNIRTRRPVFNMVSESQNQSPVPRKDASPTALVLDELIDTERNNINLNESSKPDGAQEAKQDQEITTLKLEEEIVTNDLRNLTIDLENKGDWTEQRLVVEEIRTRLMPSFDPMDKLLKQENVSEEIREQLRSSLDCRGEVIARSLEKISKDLYEKDFHFVFELVQNADDNNYEKNISPTLKFRLTEDGIQVFNNEIGFSVDNMRAICAVGKSTKADRDAGMIGRKGIGFKAVFSVCDTVDIVSNGFAVRFDASSSDLGMILPQWLDVTNAKPGTTISLNFKMSDRVTSHYQKCSKELSDLDSLLLLFLNQAKVIKIEDELQDVQRTITRTDLQVEETFKLLDIKEEESREGESWSVRRKFLVIRKELIPPKALNPPSQKTVVEVAFALPQLGSDDWLRTYPVCAFLPLNDMGFKFVLQADWNVNAARDRVREDDPWNQWLRDECSGILIEAIESLKKRIDTGELPHDYLFAVLPMAEDEVDKWFSPIVRSLLSRLRHLPCVCTIENQWVLPAQCILPAQQLSGHVEAVLTPKMLREGCGYHFVHPDLKDSLARSAPQLGFKNLKPELLLSILDTLDQTNTLESQSVEWSVQLLLVLYFILENARMQKAKNVNEMVARFAKLRILPLEGRNEKCRAGDGDLIFSPQEFHYAFESELKIVDRQLYRNRGADEPVLRMMLMRLGVKQPEPQRVLDFILEVLNTRNPKVVFSVGQWLFDNRALLDSGRTKDKFLEVLEELPVFCKIDEMGQIGRMNYETGLMEFDHSWFVEEDPGIDGVPWPPCPGDKYCFVHIKRGTVHIGPDYGAPNIAFNLIQRKLDVRWAFVHEAYMYDLKDKRGWMEFWQKCGGVIFIKYFSFRRILPPEEGKFDTWWNKRKFVKMPQAFNNSYQLLDSLCPVMRNLVPVLGSQSHQDAAIEAPKGMAENLLEVLSLLCSYAQDLPSKLVAELSYLPLLDGLTVPTEKDRQKTFVRSSLGFLLQGARWIPDSKGLLYMPSEVHFDTEELRLILSDRVPYLSKTLKPHPVLKELGIVSEVNLPFLKKYLSSWVGDPTFKTSLSHMANVYHAMEKLLAKAGSLDKNSMDQARERKEEYDRKLEAKEFLEWASESAVIWLPLKRTSFESNRATNAPAVEGEWLTPKDCFIQSKRQGLLENAHSRFRFLDQYYTRDLQNFFVSNFKVAEKAPDIVLVEVYAHLGQRIQFAQARQYILPFLKQLNQDFVDSNCQLADDMKNALLTFSIWPAHCRQFVSIAQCHFFIDDVIPYDQSPSLPESQPPVMLLGGGEQVPDRDSCDRSLEPIVRYLGVKQLSNCVKQDARFSPADIPKKQEFLLMMAWPLIVRAYQTVLLDQSIVPSDLYEVKRQMAANTINQEAFQIQTVDSEFRVELSLIDWPDAVFASWDVPDGNAYYDRVRTTLFFPASLCGSLHEVIKMMASLLHFEIFGFMYDHVNEGRLIWAKLEWINKTFGATFSDLANTSQYSLLKDSRENLARMMNEPFFMGPVRELQVEGEQFDIDKPLTQLNDNWWVKFNGLLPYQKVTPMSGPGTNVNWSWAIPVFWRLVVHSFQCALSDSKGIMKAVKNAMNLSGLSADCDVKICECIDVDIFSHEKVITSWTHQVWYEPNADSEQQEEPKGRLLVAMPVSGGDKPSDFLANLIEAMANCAGSVWEQHVAGGVLTDTIGTVGGISDHLITPFEMFLIQDSKDKKKFGKKVRAGIDRAKTVCDKLAKTMPADFVDEQPWVENFYGEWEEEKEEPKPPPPPAPVVQKEPSKPSVKKEASDDRENVEHDQNVDEHEGGEGSPKKKEKREKKEVESWPPKRPENWGASKKIVAYVPDDVLPKPAPSAEGSQPERKVKEKDEDEVNWPSNAVEQERDPDYIPQPGVRGPAEASEKKEGGAEEGEVRDIEITESQIPLPREKKEGEEAPGDSSSAPPPRRRFFLPAPSYIGEKEGFVFKSGPCGVGYYSDFRRPRQPGDPPRPMGDGSGSGVAMGGGFGRAGGFQTEIEIDHGKFMEEGMIEIPEEAIREMNAAPQPVSQEEVPDSDDDDDVKSVASTVGEVVKLKADRAGPLNKPIAVHYLLSDTSAETQEVGRLGEELIVQHLKLSIGGGKSKEWTLEDVAQYAGRWKEMILDYPETMFIEVKSSLSPNKPLFEMSMGELEMARECDKHYSLYRLRGLGQDHRPRLECIRRPLLAFNSRYFALIAHETQQQTAGRTSAPAS